MSASFGITDVMHGENMFPSTYNWPYNSTGLNIPGIQHEHFNASMIGMFLENIVGIPFEMLDETMYNGILASPIFLFFISSPALLNISVKDDSNTSIGYKPFVEKADEMNSSLNDGVIRDVDRYSFMSGTILSNGSSNAT
jgi:hypothetical protein